MYRGILTGLNTAFVIDSATRDRLIDEDPKSAELIKPWLRGRDVRRWRANWGELYAIAIASSANASWPWSGKSEGDAAAIFEQEYPAVYAHLAPYEKQLKKRQDKGEFFWELRACAYHEKFSESKIIYPDIGTEMRGYFDRERRVTGNTCYILPGSSHDLLAILNSSILDFWFRLSLPCLDDPFDGGHMRFIAMDMERAPIASASPTAKKRLAALANRVQTARQADPAADTAPLEAEIDEAVCALYGLDERNIALIGKPPRP